MNLLTHPLLGRLQDVLAQEPEGESQRLARKGRQLAAARLECYALQVCRDACGDALEGHGPYGSVLQRKLA